jgi:branched-chain amino acid transport system substrate-binding protein
MKQAASLTNFTPDVLLPGISINTGAADFAPIEQMRMVRLTGERWELFGDVISGSGEAGK